jgi:hypothetical protein
MNEPSTKRSIDLRYREKTLPAFRQLPNHRQWSEGVNSPPLKVPLPFREGQFSCNRQSDKIVQQSSHVLSGGSDSSDEPAGGSTPNGPKRGAS